MSIIIIGTKLPNDAAELHALCDLTDPKLVSLCLDIGWVERADVSVVDVTPNSWTGSPYFHLKDTKGENFVSSGRWDGRYSWLPGQAIEGKGDFYLTHERDEFLPNALESATKSRIYLRTLGFMTKKLGICIVGCGFMGQTHAQGWQSVPEAEVVAVVDLQSDRAQIPGPAVCLRILQ